MVQRERKIPYNYTSAEDDQVIRHLFGRAMVNNIHTLKESQITGRSARLVFRLMGDMFIIDRNPFILQELLDHPKQRSSFFKGIYKDLATVKYGSSDPLVSKVVDELRGYLSSLVDQIKKTASERKRITRTIEAVTGPGSVHFDPFTLTAHTTDATDWRRYPPLAVVRPAHESQVAPLILAIRGLGLNIIPRGGGTGLTGGGVPLTRTCVMINTEKLNTIHGIRQVEDGTGRSFAVIDLEAGVITEDAMAFAKASNLVFATDPTSSWASTIGGNLAENAGGKTAVLWGTAIDNVLAYKIAMPDGRLLTVERQYHHSDRQPDHKPDQQQNRQPDHQQGHPSNHQPNHPLKRILPDDRVIFHVIDEQDQVVREVTLTGDEIRRPGLGKDVTNKTLNGLPGIQKEGCDGVITSATFVLHPQFELKKTFCLEFFGRDMTEAGKVISDISKQFRNRDGQACLIALEHFDEEYIKAIDYKAKAAAPDSLKAVLLIDMVARTREQIVKGQDRLERILTRYHKTALTPADNDEEAERFWRDRKRLGAIARRTNAFKLNEDIVLPIASLAEFASFVDQTNMEERRHTQLSLVANLMTYLETAKPLEDPQWLVAKVSHARTLAAKAKIKISKAARESLERETYAREFFEALGQLLRGYTLVTENINKIHGETMSRLIVIATHMHAGDGNVHVNIPVLSNDRQMMRRAGRTADRIMDKAIELEGAVSGEHGIGITKFAHLDTGVVERFARYRTEVDPTGLMNPGKLVDPLVMEKIFTPSFNLLGLEANILCHASLGTLAASIANCVRCGRCKANCPVFFPQKDLFFHPRNKNLAVGALIEALLYTTQRTRSTKFRILRHLEEIADHCTICHKCLTQCPVNIDSGEVSVLEREILTEQNFKHTPLATSLSLNYLGTRNEFKNSLMRTVLVGMGSRIQRSASVFFTSLPEIKATGNVKAFEMLKSPMPQVSGATLRSVLPGCGPSQVVMIEPEEPAVATVFYFPGCGSERLFSQIGKASVFLLVKNRVRVILPPPFLCCGFPARVNAKEKEHQRLTLRNTIIFSQIREMFSDLDFDACIISCGTCKEALEDLDTETIFECRIRDISEFILAMEPSIELKDDYLYHPPCHDSLEGKAGTLLAPFSTKTVETIAQCCSEAGTMSMSRPDISNAMLDRKQTLLKPELTDRILPVKMLTNCPSCLQGLGRNRGLGIIPVHIAAELAEITSGTNWEKELQVLMANAEVINF